MDKHQSGYIMDPDEAVAQAQKIRHKYGDLFWRQPNVYAVGIGDIKDEDGQYTGIWGFIITVTQKVDQNTLPPEDRIPDVIEGVPVEIEEVSDEGYLWSRPVASP